MFGKTTSTISLEGRLNTLFGVRITASVVGSGEEDGGVGDEFKFVSMDPSASVFTVLGRRYRLSLSSSFLNWGFCTIFVLYTEKDGKGFSYLFIRCDSISLDIKLFLFIQRF